MQVSKVTEESRITMSKADCAECLDCGLIVAMIYPNEFLYDLVCPECNEEGFAYVTPKIIDLSEIMR